MSSVIVIMLIVIGGGNLHKGKPIENKTVVIEQGMDYCLKAKQAINDVVKKPVADCLRLTVNTSEEKGI